MFMMEGEEVQEVDMGLGTEGEFCIWFIPLQLLLSLVCRVA